MNYYSRKFLNAKKGAAIIECSAEMSTNWCNVSVKITDCNRAVSLDLDFNSIKTYKEKRNKLELLVTELNELLVAVDNKMEDNEFRKALK